MEFLFQMQHDFLFGQSIALNRRGREAAFCEVQLMKLALDLGQKGRPANMLTFRLALSEHYPKRGRGRGKIKGEFQPRMCLLVCPQKCPSFIGSSSTFYGKYGGFNVQLYDGTV